MLQRGFTLIELMITVAILGILAVGLVPLGELAVQRAKEAELRQSLRQIRIAIDAYKKATDDGRIPRKADESGYPPSLDALAGGVADAKSPAKRPMYFLRRLPRDPFFPNGSAAPEQTWGIRSYDSPPDSPSPGKDVYDVYSLDAGVGLNGVPYRKW